MNALQVITPNVQVNVGSIGIENLEAVKQGLTLIAQNYKDIVVTDDDERYKEAKDQRAEINKIIKMIDDERKRIKKLYEAPLKVFEKSVKEVVAIADEVAKELDSNIKAVEQLRRDKKQEEVNKLIAEYGEGYDIQMIERWLNQTYKTSAIIDDIKSQVYGIKQVETDRENKREMIRSACKIAKFDATGWLAMFEAGADANDVVSRISDEYDRQVRESEQKAEQSQEEVTQEQHLEENVVQEIEQKAEETQETDNLVARGIAETFAEAKVTYILSITATHDQHMMLDRFCKENNITVSKLEL